MQKQSLFRKAHASLRKLQRANNETKRRWFLGTSGISIAVVFIVWVFYVGTNIAPTKKVSSNTEPSFSDVFKIGIENMKNDLGEKYNTLKKNVDEKLIFIEEGINKTNTITIEGASDTPFVPNNLENVPEVPLP